MNPLLWVLGTPLAVFVLLFAIKPKKGGDLLAIAGMAISFGLSLKVAGGVLASGQILSGGAVKWLSFQAGAGLPAFDLSLGLRLDPMGAVMLLIVTGLALCVLVFSTWYLHGDRFYTRFFSHFSFFCFAMLGIVLSDNLLMTFVFWELVGVGSYLLIGFWHDKAAVCVVMSSGGYPGTYEVGKVITGVDDADRIYGVKVFHAGTNRRDGAYYSSGGRVLGVTARGSDLPEAVERAYDAVMKIRFDGMHYRKDIAARGLKHLREKK